MQENSGFVTGGLRETHVAHGRGALIPWRRLDTLCTSGFVNDAIVLCEQVMCRQDSHHVHCNYIGLLCECLLSNVQTQLT